MDLFTNIINEANYVLWTYVLVIMLLGPWINAINL